MSYTGEQWRRGANALTPDQLNFQYSTNATSLTTGTWTSVIALDFYSPVNSATGTPGALDGNAAANRTAVSATITGLSITNLATYWIRWTDFDRGGSGVADDGLAVDDLSVASEFTVPTTVSIWNWISPPGGSWVPLAGPTPVDVPDVTVANNAAVAAAPVAGSWASYIGTGAYKGQVRVRVLSTGATPSTQNFVTGGNLMKLVYDAP